ncbi:cyanophycinase [Sphingomonas colocasiae]|uniref:Cyanophycinase n=2 Tax=Sphingomonas colocasiae TaxID=1848973 RepID=A0ABS7PN84_9SPHN|nr:cyanophycinase [Sphingomonas colocasiae]
MNLLKFAGSLVLAFVLAAATPAAAPVDGLTRYVAGDIDAATPGPVSGGLLLMGGGDRDPAAMRWFFAKAGRGHIVILRASYGGEAGEEFYREIGGIASAETFVFSGRAASSDPHMLARLARADGIFIAGGDQANYVRYWKGTPVAAALDAHVAAGKPIAGTSAGLAMLGERLYGAMDGGSLTSAEALADPFGPANTIERDFLHIALLRGIVTDTHFKERDRLGRLMAFLAKAQRGARAGDRAMLGLGVDEDAAVAVEPDGTARLFSIKPDGGAWLVDGAGLRGIRAKGPLTAARVEVTGIGRASVLHLPSGRVEAPTFRRAYRLGGGRIVELPAEK